jgi:hypothetical protein
MNSYKKLLVLAVFVLISIPQELLACDPPPQYTLTINITGKGTVFKDPDKTTYDEGERVTLTSDGAVLGWSFSSWGGDLEGSDNPIIITMNSSMTVQANFVNKLYCWLKMDDNAPTKTVDTQWYATRNTDLMHTAGKIGGALSFNGNDYVQPDFWGMNYIFRDSFSVNLWVRTRGRKPGI